MASAWVPPGGSADPYPGAVPANTPTASHHSYNSSASSPGSLASSISSAAASSPQRLLHQLTARVGKPGAASRRRISRLTRALLVATFFEDGARVLTDLPGQARFLKHFYALPMPLGILFLLGIVTLAVAASLCLVLTGNGRAGGKTSRQDRWALTMQERASYVLIVHIFVQQALYGRDAPATGGNVSFLVRNLCLAGSFLMVAATARMKKGLAALPQGLLGGISRSGGGGAASTQKVLEYMQLAARIMLVLLPLDFLSSLGFVGTLLAVPVMLAVLAGYRTKVSGSLLILFYAVHNLLMSAFWKVQDHSPLGKYARDVQQYEFVQTISIMAGVLMLVFEGPGAISVDQQQRDL